MPLTLGYFDSTVGEIRRSDIHLVHVSLVALPAVVAQRLRNRGLGESCALERVERCAGALAGDGFGVYLDGEHEVSSQLAARILRLVEDVA